MKIQRFYRDPENIGWAGCVHINHNMEILLVRNLKREAQILAELIRQGFTTEESQKLNYKRVKWELSQRTFVDKHGKQKKGLEKDGKWELLAGGIAYWQGNPELSEEFKSLEESARKEFEEKIVIKVLNDGKLLERAADHTAESEFVEESGLIARKKILVAKANDPDRNYPNADLVYPRFWYLVTEIAGGELRKEPLKATISAPQWIPLLKLHPFSSKDGMYPIHASHILGICATARYFIKNGRPEFVEVVDYLERTFGPQKESETFEENLDWNEFAKTVEKLK